MRKAFSVYQMSEKCKFLKADAAARAEKRGDARASQRK